MDKKTSKPVEEPIAYDNCYLLDKDYDDCEDDILKLRDEYYFGNIEELME